MSSKGAAVKYSQLLEGPLGVGLSRDELVQFGPQVFIYCATWSEPDQSIGGNACAPSDSMEMNGKLREMFAADARGYPQ